MNASPLNPDLSNNNGSGGSARREGRTTPPSAAVNDATGDSASQYPGLSAKPEEASPVGKGDGDGGGGGPEKVKAPPAVSDEALLAAYRVGDKQSFITLVDRYQRELFHFLVRFLGNRVAAEDIFQETFLQVHQSAEAFDLSRRFKPWLFTIAANKARDLIRSQARRPTNPLQASIAPGDDEGGEFIDLMQSSVDLPEEPMARKELQDKVQRVVNSLPEHLREILMLSYFSMFPYRQIADILDIPLGTVKSRLHAAVATFAEKWKSANPSKFEP
ncbi:RNA polymerase sigma factor [Humisphaera borealis]|uniref:Sigma-70 family RNA polymerase sigma factor n=1 Tax=Humisphaera borealis TaxID=2807512 RepID=A0A7M2WWW3_9BACT|nr:sigma-70 family RNA polymerase sigma factor [Humisphaera borealis]QOV89321.1 sigma-70 family RNA polymerase sigma factor [Humisphaera borealis]